MANSILLAFEVDNFSLWKCRRNSLLLTNFVKKSGGPVLPCIKFKMGIQDKRRKVLKQKGVNFLNKQS